MQSPVRRLLRLPVSRIDCGPGVFGGACICWLIVACIVVAVYVPSMFIVIVLPFAGRQVARIRIVPPEKVFSLSWQP